MTASRRAFHSFRGCVMADTKFTPGPWATYVNTTRNVVIRKMFADGQESHEIARVVSGFDDARVIAAAPALYEALDQLLTDMLIAQGNMRDAAKHDPRWEGCAEEIQPRVDAALAALAKARGESNA